MRVPCPEVLRVATVGVDVVIWKLTFEVALIGLGAVHVDSDAVSVQLKETGPLKPPTKATVTVASMLPPA